MKKTLISHAKIPTCCPMCFHNYVCRACILNNMSKNTIFGCSESKPWRTAISTLIFLGLIIGIGTSWYFAFAAWIVSALCLMIYAVVDAEIREKELGNVVIPAEDEV